MPAARHDPGRRINAERLVVLAWVRAILLQLAHPLIAAGVAEHSTFRGNMTSGFSRLRHTIDAMLALTFGSDREHAAAIEAIRAIHRRVNGTLDTACGPYPAGTRYSAEDPALLLWVHATLVESIVLLHERVVMPLGTEERNRYCDSSAAVVIELGADPGAVPRSWEALTAYLHQEYRSGRIVVGPDARALADALLAPRGLGPLLKPVLRLVAAGQLPEHIRDAYGFTWGRWNSWMCEWVMKLLRAARRVSPSFLATWKRSRVAQAPMDEATTRGRHALHTR